MTLQVLRPAGAKFGPDRARERRSTTARDALTPLTVLVMAKAPVAGTVKTRLCPPLHPTQAAALAAAALLDTMDAVEQFRSSRAVESRGVLALSGKLTDACRGPAIAARLAGIPGSGRTWIRITQRGRDFGERLVNAHADAHQSAKPGWPVLQIGMDTPQISAALLAECAARLALPGVDVVLGLSPDGGWWALGAHTPAATKVLSDITMSTPRTGQDTLEALRSRGLRVHMLPAVVDVDGIGDAYQVAQLIPRSRFAAALRTAQPAGRP